MIQYLRATAENFSRRNPGYGFRGDPLDPTDPGKYYGFLVWARDIIQGRPRLPMGFPAAEAASHAAYHLTLSQ